MYIIIIIISYQFNLPIQMLTRNHKSGAYLNSMHILVVFFVLYFPPLPSAICGWIGPDCANPWH